MEIDPELKKQIQLGFEIETKHNLYKKPEFRFLHSLGIWNFINAFTYTLENEKEPQPFGVLHLYWDKDAIDNIVTPDGKPWMKGMWKHKWYEPGETIQAVSYWDRYGMSEEGKKKVEKIFTDLHNKALLRQFELASRGQIGKAEKEVIIN